MSRPSREQVEAALKFATTIELDGDQLAELEDTTFVAWLAAEVRALQVENKLATGEFAAMTIYTELLKKRLATVETLPEQWRELAMRVHDSGSPTLLVDCADDLDRALRGG